MPPNLNDDPIRALLLDIRSQKLWGQEALAGLLGRHFSVRNYEKNPILVRSERAKELDRTYFSRSGLPRLVISQRHLGLSDTSYADLVLADAAGGTISLTDKFAARMLMSIDWQILGLTARLRALERLRGETKQGLQWLTGLSGPMPSAKSLTISDKLAMLVLKSVGNYYEDKDRRQIAELQRALDAADKKSMASAILKLVESGLTRGAKLGYVVPRLTLLREAGYETKEDSLIRISTKYLAELSHQYIEYAVEDHELSACYRAGLTFLLEAAKHGSDDQSHLTGLMEELLKGALYRGLKADSLMPLSVQ